MSNRTTLNPKTGDSTTTVNNEMTVNKIYETDGTVNYYLFTWVTSTKYFVIDITESQYNEIINKIKIIDLNQD